MRSYLLVILLVTMFCKVTSDCDTSNPSVEEGNFGQSGAFPWVGVLRVYLPGEFGDKPDIALTGLVLIKKTHALVSADDVVRIPEKIFKEHTHAMFLAETESPWYCRPKSFKIHHEYEQTINTIAVLELNVEEGIPKSLLPICWSRRMPHHTSLYLIGYTDESGILEKTIHKVQYKEKKFCDDFYEASELSEAKRTPAHYVCGVTRSKHQCLWENGMVLVSNASHQFTLIGFSIRGPGCSAPARFIDLYKYQKWVEDVTTEEYRRMAQEESNVETEFKRIHFGDNLADEGNAPKPLPMKPISYGFDTQKPGYFNVDKPDNQTLIVRVFNDSVEAIPGACSGRKVLLYKEYMELRSMLGSQGVAYYKISLYDLMKKACGCVKLHIYSAWRDEASIAYKQFFDISEGTALTSSEETPSQILKHFPILERTTPATDTKWKPSHNLKVDFLKDLRQRSQLLHYDLYVRFGFHYRAIVRLEMFAQAMAPTTTPKPTVHGRRRMYDTPILTSNEERMEYEKQKRLKLTRPPTRKMWYDDKPKKRNSRSGFIQSVPDVVSNYFDGDNLNDSIYHVDVKQVDIPDDEIEEQTEESYLKFIRSTGSPDEMEVAGIEAAEIETSNHDTIADIHKFSNILPEFIINAIQSLSSAPKISKSVQNNVVNFSSKTANVFQLRSDTLICLNILVLILNS